MLKSMAAFRDKSINKWQRMTQVTTGAAAIKGKLYAFNQDISNQVAAYMRDPSRIIKQMQLRRSSVKILGSAAEVNNGSNEALQRDCFLLPLVVSVPSNNYKSCIKLVHSAIIS